MAAVIMGTVNWYRADSYPIEITVKDKDTGLGIDLTGYSFILSIDSRKEPTDATTLLFAVVGVVDADQVANAGKVAFTPSIVNTSIDPGKYFYDVQMTDGSGHVRTIKKEKWNLLQDITK